ncbi:MAG: HD domain-containing protein, partial [Planctomycetota bacterium]
MEYYQSKSLSLDPVHGYVSFTSPEGMEGAEVSEREIIDHPWVQRLRMIHQLQTAWWVFPSAEHTRFQHVVGAMHLASRVVEELFDSLQEACPDVPSRGYVESLLRMAALLHDVGHGPFGHFFDQHFLADYDLTHETLGSEIVRHELGDLLRRVRRNPNSCLQSNETLDPYEISVLITRPKEGVSEELPCWLRFLRGLFSGLYTVDNMDFVLRDAYMSGYSTRAFDLDRLLHYSFFSPQGLTIHDRGLSALVRFIAVRAELFRAIYFHRTVRAIDLALEDLFLESKPFLFPGNPLDHLEEYRRLTEWSLLERVSAWPWSDQEKLRRLGQRWRQFLLREVPWKMACEREMFFLPGEAEQTSVFSDERLFEAAVRSKLPRELQGLPLRFDARRHVHRPGAHTPASGQNFLFDSASGQIRSLDDRELFRQIPLSYRICRIYAEDDEHRRVLATAMEQLIEGG